MYNRIEILADVLGYITSAPQEYATSFLGKCNKKQQKRILRWASKYAQKNTYEEYQAFKAILREVASENGWNDPFSKIVSHDFVTGRHIARYGMPYGTNNGSIFLGTHVHYPWD